MPRGKTKRKAIAIADDLTSGDETEPCSEDPITPDDVWQSKLSADSRGPIRPGVLAMDAALAAAAADNPTNTPAAAMVSGGLGEPDPRNRKMHAFFAAVVRAELAAGLASGEVQLPGRGEERADLSVQEGARTFR
jgi:hypothetical protein